MPITPTTPGIPNNINGNDDTDNHNTNSTNKCLPPRIGSPLHVGIPSPTHQWHQSKSSHQTSSWPLPDGNPPPPHLKGLEHAKEILGKLSSPLSTPTLKRNHDATFNLPLMQIVIHHLAWDQNSERSQSLSAFSNTTYYGKK